MEKQLGCAEHFGHAWFPERKVREMTVYLEHLYKACRFAPGLLPSDAKPKECPIDPDGEGCVDLDLGVWIPCAISEPAVEAFVYGTVELQPLLQAQLCSKRAGGAWSVVKGAEANRECVVVYRNVAEGRKQLFSSE